MPALRLSVVKAAELLGVSRQTGVTPEMAVRLGKFCGNGPHFWLRMQQARDLWRAERELADIVGTIPTVRGA